jgi:hypothetical protein
MNEMRGKSNRRIGVRVVLVALDQVEIVGGSDVVVTTNLSGHALGDVGHSQVSAAKHLGHVGLNVLH